MRFSFVLFLRRFVMIFCAILLPGGVFAQSLPSLSSESDIQSATIQRDRQSLQWEREPRGPFARKPASYNEETYRLEGLPKDPTVIDQVQIFFKDLVGGIRLGKKATAATTDLKLEPKEIDLNERREISTVFSVANRTKKMMVLEFPTQQRADFVIRSADGSIIERWSDDRTFLPEDGFVAINPNERIEYSEKIATREMKSGQTYHIDAKMAEYPEYQASVTTTPKGNIVMPETTPSQEH